MNRFPARADKKAVNNQQFNQSEHDYHTRFCFHGTAASMECLQVPHLALLTSVC